MPLRGIKFEPNERGSSSTTTYRGSLVGYLDAANEITTTMFPSDAETPLVEFDVLIQGAPNIKEINLTLDGETIRYRNGPEVWTSMKWPGEGNKGMRIEAKGFGVFAEIEREGEWGLFRVLEEGTVKALAGPARVRGAVGLPRGERGPRADEVPAEARRHAVLRGRRLAALHDDVPQQAPARAALDRRIRGVVLHESRRRMTRRRPVRQGADARRFRRARHRQPTGRSFERWAQMANDRIAEAGKPLPRGPHRVRVSRRRE